MPFNLKQHFRKTKLCPLWLEGNCPSELNCDYAHAVTELRVIPDLRKTKLCPRSVRGQRCADPPTCAYAHGEADLRSTSNLWAYKTAMCSFHLRRKCLNGTKCRFAHSASELRPPPQEGPGDGNQPLLRDIFMPTLFTGTPVADHPSASVLCGDISETATRLLTQLGQHHNHEQGVYIGDPTNSDRNTCSNNLLHSLPTTAINPDNGNTTDFRGYWAGPMNNTQLLYNLTNALMQLGPSGGAAGVGAGEGFTALDAVGTSGVVGGFTGFGGGASAPCLPLHHGFPFNAHAGYVAQQLPPRPPLFAYPPSSSLIGECPETNLPCSPSFSTSSSLPDELRYSPLVVKHLPLFLPSVGPPPQSSDASTSPSATVAYSAPFPGGSTPVTPLEGAATPNPGELLDVGGECMYSDNQRPGREDHSLLFHLFGAEERKTYNYAMDIHTDLESRKYSKHLLLYIFQLLLGFPFERPMRCAGVLPVGGSKPLDARAPDFVPGALLGRNPLVDALPPCTGRCADFFAEGGGEMSCERNGITNGRDRKSVV